LASATALMGVAAAMAVAAAAMAVAAAAAVNTVAAETALVPQKEAYEAQCTLQRYCCTKTGDSIGRVDGSYSAAEDGSISACPLC